MTKRYLKTPEEVIDALQDGKVVIDGEGYSYKLYRGIIFWKYKNKWAVTPTTSCLYGLYVNEPEPLKLEVGKFYKTWDGRKAWIMEYLPTEDTYPFRVAAQKEYSIYTVTKEGRRYSKGVSGLDLVAPWEEAE